MARLRAVEHGRTALMAADRGISRLRRSRGRVYDATGFQRARRLVAEVTAGRDPYDGNRLGALPEVPLVIVAIGFAGAGGRQESAHVGSRAHVVSDGAERVGDPSEGYPGLGRYL